MVMCVRTKPRGAVASSSTIVIGLLRVASDGASAAAALRAGAGITDAQRQPATKLAICQRRNIKNPFGEYCAVRVDKRRRSLRDSADTASAQDARRKPNRHSLRFLS
jgi:hypothetical protein